MAAPSAYSPRIAGPGKAGDLGDRQLALDVAPQTPLGGIRNRILERLERYRIGRRRDERPRERVGLACRVELEIAEGASHVEAVGRDVHLTFK